MPQSGPFRIVHAIAQLRFGAGRYVVDTAVAQHRREPGRVAVLVSEDAESPWRSSPALLNELRAAGVTVIVAGDFFHRQMPVLKAAAAHIRAHVLRGAAEWPADTVVHAHTAMASTVARWAGAPRVVLTCHGWGPGRTADVELQDALAYSLCDVVTSPSEGWAAIVRERTVRASIPVIPYGFDIDRLQRRTRDSSPDGPARVISVGELSQRKGADLLLESMPRVWERFPEAELHFVGGGELMASLTQRAQTLGAGTRVVFHGQLDDPSVLLADSDVFALASRSDNQPLAIIEAMAAGLPIVSTGVGGIAELVTNARCGFVVPPENTRELSAALRVLIEAGGLVRSELGTSGAAFVRAHCDIDSHLRELDVLYRPDAPQVKVSLPLPGQAVRLHIGASTRRREGWINIDVRADVRPDIVARAHELSMFADGSVDAIEACHLFEHLPPHEAKLTLAEWARVLRTGGELFLELPNLEACVRLIARGDDEGANAVAMMGIFGWPDGIERYGDAFAHRWGWSPRSLAQELAACGFESIEELPLTQTWRPSAAIGADFRLRAVRAAHAEKAA